MSLEKANGRTVANDNALRIRVALEHHFSSAMNATYLREMALANNRRADLMVILPKGEIWIIEIKSGKQDFETDSKWPEYRDFCDRFFFATMDDFPPGLIPSDVGYFITDGFDVVLQQDAPLDQLAAARRKAVMLRFAQAAARRLASLEARVLEARSAEPEE